MKSTNTIEEVKQSHKKLANMTGDRFAVIVTTNISKTKSQFGVQYWTKKMIEVGFSENTDKTISTFVELLPQNNDFVNFTVSQLALEFSNILKSWLSSDQMIAVNARNEGAGDSCATHDFCDANEAMIEAFTIVFKRDIDFQSDTDMMHMNKSWYFAKTNKFFL